MKTYMCDSCATLIDEHDEHLINGKLRNPNDTLFIFDTYGLKTLTLESQPDKRPVDLCKACLIAAIRKVLESWEI